MKKFLNTNWDLLAVIAWFILIFIIAQLVACTPTQSRIETHVKYKIISIKRVDNPGKAVWPIDPRYEVALENGDTIHTTHPGIFHLDSVEYVYVKRDGTSVVPSLKRN